MDRGSARRASDLLARCWREGQVIDALPPPLRPVSRAEGYAIQAEIEALSEKPLFGWKIAATSVAGQKHIGVDGPLAGRLLAERVHGDDDEIPLGANRMRVAECEFAFRMGRDLPPRETPYEREDVLDAVADLCLAIEVPDSRYADFVTAGGPRSSPTTPALTFLCWVRGRRPFGASLISQRIESSRRSAAATIARGSGQTYLATRLSPLHGLQTSFPGSTSHWRPGRSSPQVRA